MDTIKVGVVGVGRMGGRHARVFSNLRKVHLVGVYDSIAATGQRVAGEYGAAYYDNLDALLDDVDAVSLAAPTPLHFDLAMRCLERGRHLLIEKPISETLEQAEALVQAAERSGKVVQVGHIERFNPAYMEFKNVLDSMVPLAINIRRMSPFQGSNKDVDVVLDLMIHDTNLVLDLMRSTPENMTAYGLKVFSPSIDHAVAHLGFCCGPMVTMTSSRVTEHKIRSIEVAAQDAYIECDLLDKRIFIYRSTIGEYLNNNHRGVKYRQESIVEQIQVPSFEPLFLQLQHFVDCIYEGKTPSVSARDGLNALQMAYDIRDRILPQLTDLSGERAPLGAMAIPEGTH
jgi:predicted dehydrogenase